MDGGVKRAPGRLGTRAGQARATRRRITAAATELFVRQGYAATTLAEIAAAAGVAVQTVYFHFANKPGLLKAAVDVAAVGDDEPVPLLERSESARIRDESDPRLALALSVRQGRAIFARVGPIMRVVRDAAGVDVDMAAQWRANEQQRAVAFTALARQLAEKNGLREGLSVEDAADIIFALHSLELYYLLTETRGWTAERWEGWLTETLSAAVLR